MNMVWQNITKSNYMAVSVDENRIEAILGIRSLGFATPVS